jgi:hypothetical protein
MVFLCEYEDNGLELVFDAATTQNLCYFLQQKERNLRRGYGVSMRH